MPKTIRQLLSAFLREAEQEGWLSNDALRRLSHEEVADRLVEHLSRAGYIICPGHPTDLLKHFSCL